MLRLIESTREKIATQKEFERRIRAAWRGKERRTVVWRPGREEFEIAHDGTYWFASRAPSNSQPRQRYWNSFGQYQQNGNLEITVEINISTNSNLNDVKGFFARDDETKTTYLLHDGGVGGGHIGVSRHAFIRYSGLLPVSVSKSSGDERLGILIGALDSKDLGRAVSRYVARVANFKAAVRDGGLPLPSPEEQEEEQRYRREHSGKKKGLRKAEFEYITRHGDIVDALKVWRESTQGASGDRVTNTDLIDLQVRNRSGKLTELYEVKTSVERQSVYTAIGQIEVHSGSSRDLQRFVVLPSGSDLSRDLAAALDRLGIRVLRFTLTQDSVTIHAPN